MQAAEFDLNPIGDAGYPILETLCKLADTLATGARGDTEIVVHDLTRIDRSIVKIINGHLSGRKVGDLLAPPPIVETKFRAAMGKTGQPYEVRPIAKRTVWITADRPIQSNSLLFFDGAGKARAMICVNVDEGVGARLRRDFDMVFNTVAASPESEPRDNHMGQMVQDIVEEAIHSVAAGAPRMSKQEKMTIVSAMHERGVFLMRGSVEYVARRLDVTKHTIYNYFETLGINR